MSTVGIDVVSVYELFAYGYVSTVRINVVSSHMKYRRIAYGITSLVPRLLNRRLVQTSLVYLFIVQIFPIMTCCISTYISQQSVILENVYVEIVFLTSFQK